MLSVGQRKTRPRFRILACAERERRKKTVAEETGLTVKGYLSGSLGGNLEIGAQVAEKQIDIVFLGSVAGATARRTYPAECLRLQKKIRNFLLRRGLWRSKICFKKRAVIQPIFS